ncbi:hypothetical protein DID88_004198 [Monilinia fructigena]|uniref:Uncharacterized protein n=1 Tax=Monilinia fructigena TaxID=38457 RepID=A0A395IS19_9HELO|nr:hypothetical protein DID88_004198 [Monilinia fructigena]
MLEPAILFVRFEAQVDPGFDDVVAVPGVAAIGESDKVHRVGYEDETRGVRVVGEGDGGGVEVDGIGYDTEVGALGNGW